MNPKAQAVKDVLSKIKKKGVYKHPGAHDNPAVETEEHTPGKKKPLQLKTGTKGSVKSNHPAFIKPKGTVENPIASEQPGKAVKRVAKKAPSFYQKAKTRGA
jgi:hypothetical protein